MNYNDIAAMLAAGKSAEEIAKEFTDALNKATAQQKAAEEARPQLEKDIDTALRFSVDGEGMPVLLLTTAQGYVYGTIAYDASVTTPEQFLAVIDGNKENRDKIRALVKAIDESTGVDKLILLT